MSTRVTRAMIAVVWLVASATMGCGDGRPCDPDQRYERGLCVPIEQDAAVPDDDGGPDAAGPDASPAAPADRRAPGDAPRAE